MLGVNKIFLIDFDWVTKSNLNRCVFFRPEDHKKTLKVEAIKNRLPKIAPHTEVISYPVKIEEAPEEVWNVDLTIICVDDDFARFVINAKALSFEAPMPIINGAMGKTFVDVKILIPGITACLVCLWTEDYYSHVFNHQSRIECDKFFVETLPKFPAVSTLTSIVGGIMTAEATKILVGIEQWRNDKTWDEQFAPNIGKYIRYDIMEHDFSISKLYHNPKCVEIFCKKRKKENNLA